MEPTARYGRIISARKATAHERRAYEEGNFWSTDKEQKAEIKALANLPDEKIDTTDIPEILDWSGAKRGLAVSAGEAANHSKA